MSDRTNDNDIRLNKKRLFPKGFATLTILTVLVFAVIVYCSVSMAWFSSSKTTEAGGMEIAAKNPAEDDITVSVFPVTAIATSGGYTNYTFINQTLESLPVFNPDPQNIDSNIYMNSAILRLEFKNNGRSSHDYTFTGSDSAFAAIHNVENYFSNVVSIRPVTNTPSLLDATLVATAESSASPFEITTVESNTVVQTTTGDQSTQITVASDPSSEMCVAWFILEYNEDVIVNISQIIEAQLEADGLFADSISYTQDLAIYVE